jgi:hypothetical protein
MAKLPAEGSAALFALFLLFMLFSLAVSFTLPFMF